MAVSSPLPTGSFFSSSFLQKLSNLVQSIPTDSFRGKPASSDKRTPSKFRNCALQFAPKKSFPWRHSNGVPRLSLEIPRGELDERSEALDLEIEDLMEYWESWSYLTGGCRTSRMESWERGHPLDLNDEFIREDPNYDEEKVNREALRDYLKETGVSDPDSTSGQAGGKNRGSSATEVSDGGPAGSERRSTPTRARPKQKPRAMFKKPRAVRGRANTPRRPSEFKASSSEDSGEEGEFETPTKKKKSQRGGARGHQEKTAKKRQTSADKRNPLDVPEPNAPEHSASACQPTMTARAKRGQARDSGEFKVLGVQGKFSIRKISPASPVEQQPSGSQLEKEGGGEGAADPQKRGAGDGGVSGFVPGPGSEAKLEEMFGRRSRDN